MLRLVETDDTRDEIRNTQDRRSRGAWQWPRARSERVAALAAGFARGGGSAHGGSRRGRTTGLSIGLTLITGVAAAILGSAQSVPESHTHPPGTPPHAHPPAPIRTTAEELHQHGGVPPGWRFTLPVGDPTAGRAVFVKLGCYTCHKVEGEVFPTASTPSGETGPALSEMGAHHPAEYFAEKVLNPNAVILTGPGYTGPDGLSVMPDYRESLDVEELIDLVAYLKSLTGGDGDAMPGMSHGGMAPAGPVGTPAPQ